MTDPEKQAAAYKAVDDLIKDNMIVGIGSGSTVIHVSKRLAEKIKKENLTIKCIPSSFQARELIINNGLVLTDLEQNPQIDLTIDGADEVDADFNLIKGGGGCLMQEKIIAHFAKCMVVVADHTKDSKYLGQQYKNGIPMEVLPLAYKPIMKKIEEELGGKTNLRMAKMKAGPVVTDNGNFVVDWMDFKQGLDWKSVEVELKRIPGLLETGLFVNKAQKAYFGQPDGSVKERTKCGAKAV